MLDHGMGSVLTAPNVAPAARVHPTEKPHGLIERLVRAVPGDDVFDPFMGSGSTGVAALRAGRRFVGCEINPTHFDTACRRVEEIARQADMFRKELPEKPQQTNMFAAAE